MVHRGGRTMSWGAIIGGGVALIGGAMSRRSAKDASRQAAQADAERLAFEKERHAEWKAIYGPIQENLAEFYNNLSADYFETAGLESLEIEKARSLDMIETSMAQRGLGDSGLEADAVIDLERDTMQQRAAVRKNAPIQAANERMRFLQVGLGSDPSNSMANALADRADSANRRLDRANQDYATAAGSALTGVGNALEAYINSPSSTPTPEYKPGQGGT